MEKLKVVGLGPGHEDYILPAAHKAVGESQVLIGGRRNLESFPDFQGETLTITKDLASIIQYIKENRANKKIAIILSGDTGFYSMLNYLNRYFTKDEMEVIPGLTSLQYLYGRMKETWQGSPFISLHGREEDFVGQLKKYKKIGLLTDNFHTPEEIARILIKSGLENTKMVVGENLSYPEERIIQGRPEEIIENGPYKMSVVVIKDE